MQVRCQFMDRLAARHVVDIGGEPCMHDFMVDRIDESQRLSLQFGIIRYQGSVIVVVILSSHARQSSRIIPVFCRHGLNRQNVKWCIMI